jgi:hypothetical protein
MCYRICTGSIATIPDAWIQFPQLLRASVKVTEGRLNDDLAFSGGERT